MMSPDYDDPDHLTACIAAITLKAHPRGLLNDWLAGAEVPITIAPDGRRKGKAWLDISELEELPWASWIQDAALLSDHLEGSSALFLLTQAERLTITIRGDDYHNTDLDAFHNAIENLGKLKELKLVVSEAALGRAKDLLFWPGRGLTCVIETEVLRRKAKRGRSAPDAGTR